ncbi:hypothetical protein ILP97_15500 [Amycolatopsis sp. H6(2020)]|nr:hypothetical protein [Amycolatopsis sp. H6(2020)]
MTDMPGEHNRFSHDASTAVGLAVLGCVLVYGGVPAFLAKLSGGVKAGLEDYLTFAEIYFSTLGLAATLTVAVVVAFFNPMVLNTGLFPGHLVLGGGVIAGGAYFVTKQVPVISTGGPAAQAVGGLRLFAEYYGPAFIGGVIVGATGGYLVLRAIQYMRN